ncbi:nucleopolyhedrovirus P10 family protein [Streptomyces coffeae]|uniref:Nucleopolyhedrovirus P10 family protein n=1 Tax=Streptomyces coffeae TaxID=621382 RepID=A0ABS1NAZ6_9ACTN|nr:nucleopolyhedrovirus P10 family protein [Streptomyces coffeae]MBL1097251.1 nucleopolyhedrovirus P10 family protein [Streptomyces coffeae]
MAVVTGQLAHAVRQQLRLGRLLPLGGPEDGTWLTEQAAEGVLRRVAAGVPGIRLDGLRIGPADPDAVGVSAVPPPPSALPPVPLRIGAECGATVDEPLPVAADRLRNALLEAVTDRLGLAVDAVDLRVTEVLDGPPPPLSPPRKRDADQPVSPEVVGSREAAAAAAARAVPGVTRLAPVLGSARGVHADEAHLRLEVAVAADHRALDVARQVRTAVAEAVAQPVTVAVLITAVDVIA